MLRNGADSGKSLTGNAESENLRAFLRSRRGDGREPVTTSRPDAWRSAAPGRLREWGSFVGWREVPASVRDLEAAIHRVDALRDSGGHPLDLRRAWEERKAARQPVRDFYAETDERWRFVLESLYPEMFPQKELLRARRAVGLLW